MKINYEQAEKYLRNISDEDMIETMFSIIDKNRVEVPFILNKVQKQLGKEFADWNVVLKYRKPGVSVYVQAKFLSRCLRRKNRNAVVLSFDKEAGGRMLDRTRWIIDHLPFKVSLDRESKNEFYIGETNSKMYIGTPGSKSFGRGDDITELHISEYAFFEDTSIMTGLMEALTNDAFVVIESTANGPTNDYAKLYRKAREGRSKWKAHFFPWWIDDELEMDPPPDFQTTEEEKELLAIYPQLTGRKIFWRRNKLLNMPEPELFPQEFPASEKEAFLILSGCVFSRKGLLNYDHIVCEPDRRGELLLVG